MINATLSLLLGTGRFTFMQEWVPLKPRKVFSSPESVFIPCSDGGWNGLAILYGL